MKQPIKLIQPYIHIKSIGPIQAIPGVSQGRAGMKRKMPQTLVIEEQ